MRLIDADGLLEELKSLEPRCANKYVKQGIDDGLHYYMPKILEEQPTIDAVPVVRCRECKHHHREQDPCHGRTEHLCDRLKMEVFKDFFCWFGERKDGEG